jgi:hypothetical protein
MASPVGRPSFASNCFRFAGCPYTSRKVSALHCLADTVGDSHRKTGAGRKCALPTGRFGAAEVSDRFRAFSSGNRMTRPDPFPSLESRHRVRPFSNVQLTFENVRPALLGLLQRVSLAMSWGLGDETRLKRLSSRFVCRFSPTFAQC